MKSPLLLAALLITPLSALQAADDSANGSSSNNLSNDCYTAKYDAAVGALHWEKRYNGPGNSHGRHDPVGRDSAPQSRAED